MRFAVEARAEIDLVDQVLRERIDLRDGVPGPGPSHDLADALFREFAGEVRLVDPFGDVDRTAARVEALEGGFVRHRGAGDARDARRIIFTRDEGGEEVLADVPRPESSVP